MSESEDSGPGRREVAHRLFAAEFDDSEFSYSESDEERAPNYVVTPTGARVNRLFAVGVLTELEQVNDDVLRARIVDPTGPFVVYAGQYQPEALAFLEAATPPLFAAVTGKARTFEPEDGDRVFTSIRPESISEVDAETRDRWVVQAAEQTVARVGRMASAKQSGASGDALRESLVAAGVADADAAGATLALDYYGTTGEYLQAVRDLALDSARVVAGERDEAGSLALAPDDGTDGPVPTLSTVDIDAEVETPPSEADTPAGSDSTASTADAESPDTAESTSTGSEPVSADTASTDAQEPSKVTETETAEDVAAETSESATEEADASADPTANEASNAVSRPADDDTAEPSDSAETDVTEPTATSTDAGEGSSGTLGNFDSTGASADETTGDDVGAASESDDVGEFDTEFELDDEEREEIEQEYGTDFQSGTEVDDAGEADIETPDPEELAETEADAMADAESAATASGDDTAAADPQEDVELEDAVMDAMQDLDDGNGADREAVISAVVDDYGAARDDVADAIQDALMGGRCYEPDDGKLTPI